MRKLFIAAMLALFSTAIQAATVRFTVNGQTSKATDIPQGTSHSFSQSDMLLKRPCTLNGCIATLDLATNQMKGENLSFSAPGWQYLNNDIWVSLDGTSITVMSETSYQIRCQKDICENVIIHANW